MATQRPYSRSVLLFCVKFLFLAPLCLLLWWLILPAYTWLLGQLTGMVLKYLFHEPILAVRVLEGGGVSAGTDLSHGAFVAWIVGVLKTAVSNTGTILAFLVGEQVRSFPVGMLATNIAPFAALILSTGGLGLIRRLKALGIGLAILVAGHVLYIPFAFVVSSKGGTASEIPNTLGEFFITLPFLLWIVLAYSRSIMSFLDSGTSRRKDTFPPGK